MSPEEQQVLFSACEFLIKEAVDLYKQAHSGNADAKKKLEDLVAHAKTAPAELETEVGAHDGVTDNALDDKFPT